MGLSLNRPAPTNCIADFRKKYPTSKLLNYGERSEKRGNAGASGGGKGELSFPAFRSRVSSYVFSQDSNYWRACPQARKNDKGSANSQGGGGGCRAAVILYPLELWNPCDFRRFPTTSRKCRNVRRSVFRRRVSTSELL